MPFGALLLAWGSRWWSRWKEFRCARRQLGGVACKRWGLGVGDVWARLAMLWSRLAVHPCAGVVTRRQTRGMFGTCEIVVVLVPV